MFKHKIRMAKLFKEEENSSIKKFFEKKVDKQKKESIDLAAKRKLESS